MPAHWALAGLPAALLWMEMAVSLAQGQCQVHGTTVDCSGLHLLQVPPALPRDTEVLDLSYNGIGGIQDSDFARLPRLRVLRLNYNNISRLAEAAFASNPWLEELNLFNNSLRTMPGSVLAPLPRLVRLDLSNNLYRTVRLSPAFANLSNLRDLSIGGELIHALRRGDLSPLSRTRLTRLALKTGSSLAEYEAGSLSVLRSQSVWTDIAVDRRPQLLPALLSDLYRTPATSLRLRRLFEFTYYAGDEDLFRGLRDSRIRNLTFFRGKFSEKLLGFILLNLQGSAVRNLTLEAIDFARSPNASAGLPDITGLELEHLSLQDISNPDVLRFNQGFGWLGEVRSLLINQIAFNYVPCGAWRQMRRARLIDISRNQLREDYIYNRRCQYAGTMQMLEEFRLGVNLIGSLRAVALLTARWPVLSTIDLSHNLIGPCQPPCPWGPALGRLVLHHNPADPSTFACLPRTLRYLDLSHCQLERLEPAWFSRAPNLSTLLLSGNRLKFIPAGWRAPALRRLELDGNSFGAIGPGSFRLMPLLRSLGAGDNPYHCTCDLHRFLSEARSGRLLLLGWPAAYVCYHPPALLDTRLADYSPGRLQCEVGLALAISVSASALLAVGATLVCWRYDLPWYVRATWQVVRSRYRSSERSRDPGRPPPTFHAFVSYSRADAEWVMQQLLARLEAGRSPYRVCIHERDFTPGRWIIDNIIENMERSRKVLFVLSRGFVDSEWCNYELYFAHQRPLGRSLRDAVLLLLEPICPRSLPSRFCRLRRLLDSRTYLEWPAEPSRQPFFWAQLRGLLGKPEDEVSSPAAQPS
ncbi:toll-like receptor 18 [Pristis pectinata]|uniref:toll-like receptor 18 n=1 Tax=Pristis pectinata TaxID=685728 RepID=UPI00223E65B5|nr:toll-like receptor 18 [Pristis pectinata]